MIRSTGSRWTDAMARPAPGRRRRWLCALANLLLVCVGVRAEVLPQSPPAGLRLELSLECDFSEHYWRAIIHFDRPIPVDIQLRKPAFMFERSRNYVRELPAAGKAELYAAVRELIGAWQLGAQPGGESGPLQGGRTRERTLHVGLLTVLTGVGRVDELHLAIDLSADRRLGPGGERLQRALTELDRRLDLDMNCAG